MSNTAQNSASNADIIDDPNTVVSLVEITEDICDICGMESTCLRINVIPTLALLGEVGTCGMESTCSRIGVHKHTSNARMSSKTIMVCPRCIDERYTEAIINYIYEYIAEIRMEYSAEENVISYKGMLLCPYHFIHTLKVLKVQSVQPNEIGHAFTESCQMCLLDAAYSDILKRHKQVSNIMLDRIAEYISPNKQILGIWKTIKKENENETI